MNYLLSTVIIVCIILFLFGMLTSAEEKAEAEVIPQDEPHEETPEIAPDIYAGALAYLLIDAELRALQLVQRRGDDEAGKGAKV